jgi:hypothetical protein
MTTNRLSKEREAEIRSRYTEQHSQFDLGCPGCLARVLLSELDAVRERVKLGEALAEAVAYELHWRTSASALRLRDALEEYHGAADQEPSR